MVLVFIPRALFLIVIFVKRSDLKFRKIHSIIRSVTSVFMFGFCLSYLVTLVLLYKGSSNITALTFTDIIFLHSDPMKWAIIFLALILIFGTMIDLYLSLVVRTYYLVQFYYPNGAQSEAKY